MKRTISAMSGKGSVNHNRRLFTAENVDPTRSHLNVEYCYTPIEQAYDQLFGKALAAYNAKQKRKDRRIDNYYEKIRQSKQEKPFYEVIFQIGNKDDMGAATENGELAASILDKFFHDFIKRNPQLHVYSAHLHLDEATPHLHIDFIPFISGSNRGLSTRVSLKQALAAQKYVVQEKKEGKLKKLLKEAKATIANLTDKLDVALNELAALKSIKGGLRAAELERENSRLKDKLRRYEETIRRNGLSNLFAQSRRTPQARDKII